jgi:large subunit ribosomal protein L10e
VPAVNIVKYAMGNEKAFDDGKFPYRLTLVSKENVQIRDSALEACRQLINKKLDKGFNGQYVFKVIPYPHHIQRENKMLTGAGADRMQTGMQLSFGKTVDRAAILKAGASIFFIATGNKKAEQTARQMFHVVRSKLPCKTRIESEIVKQ